MNPIIEKVIVAAGAALVMWILGWVRAFLGKKVRLVQGEVQAKLCLAVNMLIELKGPEQNMLIALGEGMKGEINGNVDSALEGMRAAVVKFDAFRDKASQIEVGRG